MKAPMSRLEVPESKVASLIAAPPGFGKALEAGTLATVHEYLVSKVTQVDAFGGLCTLFLR